MKLKDIVKNVIRLDSNKCYVGDDLWQEFDLNPDYLNGYIDLEENGFSGYYYCKWYCSDSIVGYAVHFLHDEFFGISVQKGRKCQKQFYFVNTEMKQRVYAKLLSLIPYKEFIEYNPLDMEEDIPDFYTIDYAEQVLDNMIPYYQGIPVKITKLPKGYANEEVTISFANKSKKVDITELKFKLKVVENGL